MPRGVIGSPPFLMCAAVHAVFLLEITNGRHFAPRGRRSAGLVRRTSDEAAVSFRFATYEARHDVSIGAPRELAEDVHAWLAERGALVPR